MYPVKQQDNLNDLKAWSRREYGVIHQWPTQIRHDASDAGKDPAFRIATAAVNPFRSAGDAGAGFKYANRVWMKTPGG